MKYKTGTRPPGQPFRQSAKLIGFLSASFLAYCCFMFRRMHTSQEVRRYRYSHDPVLLSGYYMTVDRSGAKRANDFETWGVQSKVDKE